MSPAPKILLIDDSREFLQVMEATLNSLGNYQVFCLDQPQAAVTMAQRINPDVIVLDVYMPGLSGQEVCRQFKSDPQLRHIPVLFLTAVGSDGRFRARCLEEGGDDFLEKPVSSEELIARIRVLLRIKSLQDELRRERDELERKVQARAQELKQTETLAAIGKMVAGVAHEIRNPLGAISNSAAVLSRDLILEGEDRKLMEIIVREANRLKETINEFLTFAHPAPYYFAPVDLSRIIEDVLFLVRRDTLCTREVDVQVDIASDLPLVQVDRDRLQRILWNLIRNSLEALKGKGQITLRAERKDQEGISGVEISLSDNGPGIPPQDRDLIFEPFFTRKARGSGLGLALVHNAVKAHGGRIALEERAGQRGCEFHIWLPLEQENIPVVLESSSICKGN